MRWLRATGGHERWGRRRVRLSGMTGWNGGFSVGRFVGCSLGVLASVHGWDAAGLRVWGVL
jgi:hypothetical protein